MSSHRAAPGRWVARPRWARAVRLAIFAGPVITSFVAALVVTSMMPPSEGTADQLGHLVVLILVSSATLLLLDRAT